MNCPINLDDFPKITTKFRSDEKQLASLIPVIVVKKLLNAATMIHISRDKTSAMVMIYYPFLGIQNHFRRVYFPRSELIDPFTWEVEDPEQFLQELLQERELLEKAGFAAA